MSVPDFRDVLPRYRSNLDFFYDHWKRSRGVNLLCTPGTGPAPLKEGETDLSDILGREDVSTAEAAIDERLAKALEALEGEPKH